MCFARQPECVSCGRVGTMFALEKSTEQDHSPHFNLYCVEGHKEILMTHDHILPKSKGGKDAIDNIQTMCAECNLKKEDIIVSQFLMNNLKEFIADLIANGMSDNNIYNCLMSPKVIDKIGFKVTGNDLVAMIRQFMSEQPKSASVCTECTPVRGSISPPLEEFPVLNRSVFSHFEG
jgi:hypothetical protein